MTVENINKKVDRLIERYSQTPEQQQEWLDLSLLTESERAAYTVLWDAIKQRLPVVQGVLQLDMKLLTDNQLAALKTWLTLFVERAEQ